MVTDMILISTVLIQLMSEATIHCLDIDVLFLLVHSALVVSTIGLFPIVGTIYFRLQNR